MNSKTSDQSYLPSPDRLYQLLPAIHRLRDSESGEPLRALLQVISEQVNQLEADIAQSYENWFIETCEDWVVPYIGELLGYRVVYEAGTPSDITTAAGQARNRILMPRRDVARTLRNRRRRGTFALLEMLAEQVAHWPTRAVEFYRLLAQTQQLNHLRLERGRTVDLRHSERAERLNGPFADVAHTIDIRRPNSQRTPGRYNLPSIGLFVWRLQPYALTEAPALCNDRRKQQYTFSILGNDTQLFTLPIRDADVEATEIAGAMNVPAPLRRHAFEEHTLEYYGRGKSLCVWRNHDPIPADDVVAADLRDWSYRPKGNQVAIDPELGRIVFGPKALGDEKVRVSYHYGFSTAMGGGEYQRHLLPVEARQRYRVSQRAYGVSKAQAQKDGLLETLAAALERWREEKPADAVIEIEDSHRYKDELTIEFAPEHHRLEIRAVNGARPTLWLPDDVGPDAFRIKLAQYEADETSAHAPRLILDGLLIARRGLQISGALHSVTLRHCTLVPGWELDHRCEPQNENEPSIELVRTTARLMLEHCITGAIRIEQDEVNHEPLLISIADSVLDATAPHQQALGSTDKCMAHVVLTLRRSTVFGHVCVHAIELAENSIFHGMVEVARRQYGCVRFCYVPEGSRTPRRFQCQPDLAKQAVTPAEQAREAFRVRPQFNGTRYGDAAYCQLSDACATEIKCGADDEAEMGVFHDLFQPQRAANLRARLEEYVPAGMDAGIIYAS